VNLFCVCVFVDLFVFFCAVLNGVFAFLMCFGVCDVLLVCSVFVFFVDLFGVFLRGYF